MSDKNTHHDHLDTASAPAVPALNQSDLAAGLRALGLGGGMGVMVHSSLKSFGRVEGGALTTNGGISDAFWRMPGVHRSLDPTHAYACWGAHR